MPAIRAGIYYRHIFDGGGYPRDVLALSDAINGDRVETVPITGFRQFLSLRRSLDIVHFFGMFMPDLPFAALAARRSGLPSVWSPLAALLPHAMHRSAAKKKIFLALGSLFALRSANAIHVFTDNEKKSITGLGIDTPVFKAPFGLFPEDRPARFASKRDIRSISPYLLFLGRLDVKQKGLDILIDGYTEYMRSGGDYRLVICGKDWKQGEAFVRSRISNLGIAERVSFLGAVDEDEKYALMSGAAAFVYPTRHDGPPRPVRDALLMGKRILVSHESNIHDNVEGLGWGYCYEADPRQFAEAIKKLESESSTPAYTDPLSILGWDTIGQEFVGLYRRLVDEQQDWSMCEMQRSGKTPRGRGKHLKEDSIFS